MGNETVNDIDIYEGQIPTPTLVSLINFLLDKIPNDGMREFGMHGIWSSYSDNLNFMLNELAKKIAKPKLTSLTIGGFD